MPGPVTRAVMRSVKFVPLPLQSIGDEYVAPKGLPEWKQPEFNDDDRVREKDLEFKPQVRIQKGGIRIEGEMLCFQGFWGAIWFMKNEMTVAKMFYFCFFGAFGSLFPLFSIFFKGIAMDAFQTGFLVGIRPIIEYLATPFWHGISDRFQAGKVCALDNKYFSLDVPKYFSDKTIMLAGVVAAVGGLLDRIHGAGVLHPPARGQLQVLERHTVSGTNIFCGQKYF